jgi:hypothetical protein
MHFDSCHSVLNGGSGITTGGTVSDIAINGGEFCQNSYGMFFNSGTHIRVENATIGSGAGLSGNTNLGVVFQSGCDYFTITGNDLTGNGSGTISIPATNNRYVNNNLGMISPDVAAGNNNNSGGTTTITHGLGVAPQPYNIVITPNSNWSSTLYINTSTITSTTFQVQGGTGYFGWQAKIGN